MAKPWSKSQKTLLPPNVQSNDKVVLFDGVCKLCNGASNFLIKHDKQGIFKLCSVQSAEGQAILEWFDLPTETFDTMLLVEGETAFKKSEAVLHVARHLPNPWRFLAVFRIVPRRLRDRAYDRVALNRYRLFGRYDQCTVPTADVKRRFLGHA